MNTLPETHDSTMHANHINMTWMNNDLPLAGNDTIYQRSNFYVIQSCQSETPTPSDLLI